MIDIFHYDYEHATDYTITEHESRDLSSGQYLDGQCLKIKIEGVYNYFRLVLDEADDKVLGFMHKTAGNKWHRLTVNQAMALMGMAD